jgi:hypothetical protein
LPKWVILRNTHVYENRNKSKRIYTSYVGRYLYPISKKKEVTLYQNRNKTIYTSYVGTYI